MDLLKKPLATMTRDEVLQAMRLKDEKNEKTRKENAEYVPQYSGGKLHIIKDDLGIQGVLSHADGKMYDSKSQYYKSLKEKGYVIQEQGMNKKRETRGDFNVHKELKESAQRLGII